MYEYIALALAALLVVIIAMRGIEPLIPRSIESLSGEAKPLPRPYPPQYDFTLPRQLVLYDYNLDRLKVLPAGQLALGGPQAVRV